MLYAFWTADSCSLHMSVKYKRNFKIRELCSRDFKLKFIAFHYKCTVYVKNQIKESFDGV